MSLLSKEGATELVKELSLPLSLNMGGSFLGAGTRSKPFMARNPLGRRSSTFQTGFVLRR
jgi:hypothetical protein